MSAATGLGPLEVAALTAVGVSKGPRRTTSVLSSLEQQGISPRYGLAVLVDLVAPWRRHLPLLIGEGNWGTDGDDPPADAQYTGVQLSPVGVLALASESGELGPVPLELIDGTLYAGGQVPPFDPARVVSALLYGSPDAGLPTVPTGGEVAGQIAELLAGKRARLQLGPRIVREDGSLVITGTPLGVSRDELVRNLDQRLHSSRHPGTRTRMTFRPDAPAGLTSVWDETTWRIGTRIVCNVDTGADLDRAEEWIRTTWPVTVEVACRLPAPQRKRLATWDRGDGTGLRSLGDLLGA